MITDLEAIIASITLGALSVGYPIWAILTDKKTYILKKKDQKND